MQWHDSEQCGRDCAIGHMYGTLSSGITLGARKSRCASRKLEAERGVGVAGESGKRMAALF